MEGVEWPPPERWTGDMLGRMLWNPRSDPNWIEEHTRKRGAEGFFDDLPRYPPD
jgi:hypothetical protein